MKNAIKELADEMDQNAENINAHDFVLTHRALAILASSTIGKKATLKLLRELKKERGLPGLTGVCGRKPKEGNILKRLNMEKDNWEI